MANLKSTIEDLAAEFAMSIVGALRTASIDELLSLGASRARGGRVTLPSTEGVARPRGRGGRLGRRSTADIGRMLDGIVELLGKHPEGLRAEQIREALACQAKELPRPLADGLREGRITKTGQKRATTYFVGDGGASGGVSPKRRAGRKKRAAKR
jgi:hypothetical protein